MRISQLAISVTLYVQLGSKYESVRDWCNFL
jgi:hypothetical protein